MKRIVLAAIVLISGLFLSAGAQADFSTDHEYMVIFRPGISWQEAAEEVKGMGNSYHLVDINSWGEKRYLQQLLGGLQGEYWIGGYKGPVNPWSPTAEGPWAYSRHGYRGDFGFGGHDHYRSYWGHGERPWDYSRHGHYGDYYTGSWNRGPGDGKGHARWAKWGDHEGPDGDVETHLALKSRFHGHLWEVKDEWNENRISGFIVERDLNPSDASAVPIPGAAWLFGSGVAALAGLSLAKRSNQS